MIYRALPSILRSVLAFLPLLSFFFYFAVAILVSSRRKRKALLQSLCAGLALLSFAHLFHLLCYERGFPPFVELLDSLPNGLTITVSLALFLSGLAFFVYFSHGKRKNLSLSSYQDAYDAMETGVCFYDDSGTPLLCNRYLYDFAERNMRGSLLNVKDFLLRLENGEWDGKKVPFGRGTAYQSASGEVYVLSFSEHQIGESKIHELNLTPVTELYRLTLEMARSNEELERSNQRLRKLGEEIASLKKEEENLLAKKRIHDDLGGLLLYAKSCLDKDLSEEEKAALLTFLEREAKEAVSLEKKEVGEGLLEDLEQAGKGIGVKVSYLGEKVPASEEAFVYEAAKECLLNAYGHGRARNLYVVYREEGDGRSLSIYNDGEALEGELKEGSGLSALRGLVERKGGSMEIYASPNFKVEIRMEGKI